MGGEQEGQIIILDDDDARRHDFQTILEFLGETVHALGFNEWQAVTRSKKILRPLLAILAPETGKSVSSSLLQQIRDYDSALPVMLVGTPDVAERYRLNCVRWSFLRHCSRQGTVSCWMISTVPEFTVISRILAAVGSDSC